MPAAQTAVEESLVRLGFAVERPYMRMALERGTAFGDPALVYAIAAPELG